jgi:Secretion system C-terminal sorting domain
MDATITTYEANQKTANRILLETIANDQSEMTGQQVADLTPIATQCPYAGGEGVYAARGLLGNETVYNDFAACGMGSDGGQLIQAPNASSASTISFSIYPNPSNGLAILELKNELESDGKLIVTNTLGVQLYTEVLLKGTQAVPVDLGAFQSGTYFISIVTAVGSSSKLITVKK